MTTTGVGVATGSDDVVLADDVTINAETGKVGYVKIVDGTESSDDVVTTDGSGNLNVAVNGSVAITNSDITAIKTAVEIIDNIVSGSEAQVDIVGALPAGDNNIGNVDIVTLPSLPAGDNNIGDVDVASSALPTGASTSAKQDTIIGHVDGIETVLGTIDTDTGTIAGAVDGTEMQVDIVAALPAGTNNIGDVDVLTLPALAAGTNLIGIASSPSETSTIYNGTTALTPKFANIACASSGNNTIVSAVSGKKIRVLSCALVVSAATNIYFVDSAGSPIAVFGDSTNKVNLAANGGFILPFNPVGWFETSTTNVNLNLNLSGANAVGGSITYIEV